MQDNIPSNSNPNLPEDISYKDLVLLWRTFQLKEDNDTRFFPTVSYDKESALLAIGLHGLSYRKTAERIQKNPTIVTQWAKKDPEFRRLLGEVEKRRKVFKRNQFLPNQSEGVTKTTSSKNESE